MNGTTYSDAMRRDISDYRARNDRVGLALLFATHDPRQLLEQGREDTARMVYALASEYGGRRLMWDTAFSRHGRRVPLDTGIAVAPDDLAGIYRLYRGAELVYIGKADFLRGRLKQHSPERVIPSLREIIAGGTAEVEWCACPPAFAHWLEMYELSRYERQFARLPRCNSKINVGAWRPIFRTISLGEVVLPADRLTELFRADPSVARPPRWASYKGSFEGGRCWHSSARSLASKASVEGPNVQQTICGYFQEGVAECMQETVSAVLNAGLSEDEHPFLPNRRTFRSGSALTVFAAKGGFLAMVKLDSDTTAGRQGISDAFAGRVLDELLRRLPSEEQQESAAAAEARWEGSSALTVLRSRVEAEGHFGDQ